MAFPTGLSRRRLIIAGVLAATMQTGILAAMIEQGETILEDGTPITLRTLPVDPRDLLRGEYVILNYEFSNLDASKIPGQWPETEGDVSLYIEMMRQEDGTWHPLTASFWPFPPATGNVILRSQPFHYVPSTEKPSTIRAEYGLERYYVPEGQGKVLEEARNDSRILVEVRVMPDGAARIASLRVEPEAAGGGS